MFKFVKKYFDWLQKDAPTGEIERYPEIDSKGETSVKGIFVIGDLTGIPLLKLAAESGAKRIEQFSGDNSFLAAKEKKDAGVLDFVIVGAGPAGIAAGMAALEAKYDFKILDAAAKFSTIKDFPKGKPIYAEPEHVEQVSQLKIKEGKKETLLEELYEQVGKRKDLPIEEGKKVDRIVKKNGYFEIFAGEEVYKALRVILAMGKSGSARKLGVPGEHLDKVYRRLIDPADAADEDVLVVGGGDSALETAAAVCEHAKSVTLSYRKGIFARPKEGSVAKVNRLAAAGKLKLLLDTEVKEIKEQEVILKNKDNKEIKIPNSLVYVQIGKQVPFDFFKRIGVKIEGVLSRIDKLMFAVLLLFSGVIYFGKAGLSAVLAADPAQVSWGELLGRALSFDFWKRFFTYPLSDGFLKDVNAWNWPDMVNGVLGYLSFLGFIVLGTVLLVYFFKNIKRYTASAWKTFKYLYFLAAAVFFGFIYFSSAYFGLHFLGKKPYFWYGFLYSLTILIFGLRRMSVRPTAYIKKQTWTLILIQVFPLFLLPEIILPWFGKLGLMGDMGSFFHTQVFPGGDYGHAYRLILAWPLNIYGLFSDNITAFWLLYTLFFTFGFIYFIVRLWGKGAYCGWICSCGALAETLGDEYRTLAPHGAKAKKWDNAGQWVLVAAFLLTAFKLLAVFGGINIPFIHTPRPALLDVSRMVYTIVVDIIFAGVLGVGVYFFLSGRVWCRFFCPLAALMHIYTRFSRYRIFADKKKCISCNICTKVCHMGIDVMNYANKGIPMNDVQCVRCSACITDCPMDVLSFGRTAAG